MTDMSLNYLRLSPLGVFNSSALILLYYLGRRISEISGEVREMSFRFQRLLVTLQRFNAVLSHDSLPATDCTA